MPATQSKEDASEKISIRKSETDRVLRILYVAGGFNIFAWLLMIPARPEMVLRVTNGDAARSARILAALTAAASTFEFLATPLYGRLSDRFGRRSFLLVTPLICALGRLNTFLCGDRGLTAVVVANCLDRFFAGGAFPVFLTVMSASMSDLVLGEELTVAGAGFAGVAGLAVATAPVTGSLIIRLFKNPKYCALAATLVSSLQFCYVLKAMPETLLESRRKAIDWKRCNPFSFLQFWCQPGVDGAKLRLLSVVHFLRAMPVEMHDTRMVLLKTKLGFGPDGIAAFMIGGGISTILSGVVAKSLLASLGQVNSTYVSFLTGMASLATYACASRAAHVPIAVLFTVFEGGGAVGSMLTTMAANRGMGRGEVAANLANQTTLTKVIAPLFYASLFARFGQKVPFGIATAFIAIAMLIFRLPLAQEAALDASRRYPSSSAQAPTKSS